ncbi:hypothetical protein HPP92_004294 [Vanilla planifolia]|uniref:Uncharacterized protein n=1 Tax=Vanilla planifolia TaxID=51239 RepID=A0A835VDU4_VANPL|nr:hypothetical protein HPP92_004294 [Vanilla planifolia]
MTGRCFPDGGRPEPARKDQECGLEEKVVTGKEIANARRHELATLHQALIAFFRYALKSTDARKQRMTIGLSCNHLALDRHASPDPWW